MELYKLPKNDLLHICKQSNIHTTSNDTKRILVHKIMNMQNTNDNCKCNQKQHGGRYYQCKKDKKTTFVKTNSNPTIQNTIYKRKKWICTETNLTNMYQNKPGCSLGKKTGKQCVPCTGNTSNSKKCRSCVKGNNVFFCI